MTLIIHLSPRVEKELAEYCVKCRITKSEAVKRAPEARKADLSHPYIGSDKGDGSDVSGNIKAALRAHVRSAHTRPTLRKAGYSSGDHS